MQQVLNDLSAGEQVDRVNRPHLIFIVPSLLLIVIFLFIALASGVIFVYLMAAIAAIAAAWQVWRRQRMAFVLSSDKFVVISHERWNDRLVREYSWAGIQRVASQSSVLGRLLGYGGLVMRLHGADAPVEVTFVPQVRKYEETIKARLRERDIRRVNELRESLREQGSVVEMDAREFENLLDSPLG